MQRAAAGYIIVMNDFSHQRSVTAMLQTLNWLTLEQSRINSSLIMLFRISNSRVKVDHNHILGSRNLNYLVPFSRTQYPINPFFSDNIRFWNDLPYNIKASKSLQSFTDSLKSFTYLFHQPVFIFNKVVNNYYLHKICNITSQILTLVPDLPFFLKNP